MTQEEVRKNHLIGKRKEIEMLALALVGVAGRLVPDKSQPGSMGRKSSIFSTPADG